VVKQQWAAGHPHTMTSQRSDEVQCAMGPEGVQPDWRPWRIGWRRSLGAPDLKPLRGPGRTVPPAHRPVVCDWCYQASALLLVPGSSSDLLGLDFRGFVFHTQAMGPSRNREEPRWGSPDCEGLPITVTLNKGHCALPGEPHLSVLEWRVTRGPRLHTALFPIEGPPISLGSEENSGSRVADSLAAPLPAWAKRS